MNERLLILETWMLSNPRTGMAIGRRYYSNGDIEDFEEIRFPAFLPPLLPGFY